MDMISALWVVISAIIVLDMQAGFLCLEAGAVRTKNAANVAIKNLCDVCFVSLVYWALGFGIMYGTTAFGGLFGVGPVAPALHSDAFIEAAPFMLFQMAFAATAATIVSGAVAERERFHGYIALSILMAAVIYPVAGHWIWGGSWAGGTQGWLAERGFVDFAGATVVHGVGGWAALAAVIVLGPRLGRFGPRKRVFEEHSVTISALGALLLWIGWGAFNGGSALIFDANVPVIVAYTMMTAAAGGAMTVILSGVLYRHIRVELVLNGVLAGLVAGTAGIHLLGPGAAIAIGALGAVAMILTYEVMEVAQLDDVVGAVPVHLSAGIAGSLAFPFLVDPAALPAGGAWAQFQIQLLGVAAVGAWVLSLVLTVAYALRRMGWLRARPRDEVNGLNLSENRRSNAFLTLLNEMQRHSTTSSFSGRVHVERSSEAGALALRYNKVLDSVENEISKRMVAMRREREMRTMAEDAFEAMRKAQEENAWAARHDSLSGLGNRKLLDEIISAPPTAEDHDGGLLIVAIDLDRFKDINDTYGHEAGDIVLASVGRRLQDRLRGGRDFAFRIGGDEFILLWDFKGSDTEAQWRCDALLEDLLVPSKYKSFDLAVGASIGFARVWAGESFSEVLKKADLALYEAKATGRNQTVAYSSTIGSAHDTRLNLINDFKVAIENNEISIDLQPQIEARTRLLSGVEVLARWEHPTQGRLSPAVFMDIAEELKMSAALDQHILDLALEARQQFRDALGYAPHMAVNVSARRLSDPRLVTELKARTNLPADGLSFEILETAYLDKITSELQDTLNSIRAMGVKIEVDDFGTGHASFASVLALQPDVLKIDRMFVPGIDKDPARRDLLQGLVEMAERMSAKTVIEGIETMGEAQAATEIGAHVLQGFAFSRPLPVADCIAWAKAWKARAA